MSAVVLAAGGTGGHVFPAAALAEALLARGRRPALITDARGDSYRTAAFGADAVEAHPIRAATFAPARPLATIRGLYDVIAGTLASRGLLKRLKARVVVGFGGYPSLPPMLAALAAGLPTIIHEQNAVLGGVNRLLAPHVTRMALSLAGTRRLGRTAQARSTITGNPVREAIRAVRHIPYRGPEAGGPFRLLVLGGSQGAAIFAAVVPKALSELASDMRTRLAVIQQCRPERPRISVRDAFMRRHRRFERRRSKAVPVNDMPEQSGPQAHLVDQPGPAPRPWPSSRSAGRPAIFASLWPVATDDHQTAQRGEAMADAGGGWVIPERPSFDARPSLKRPMIEALFQHPDTLATAARCALDMGRHRRPLGLWPTWSPACCRPNGNDDRGRGRASSLCSRRDRGRMRRRCRLIHRRASISSASAASA